MLVSLSTALSTPFDGNARGAATPAAALQMVQVWRQRRELARLPDSRLKDLGLSRADVAKEVARPFWEIC